MVDGAAQGNDVPGLVRWNYFVLYFCCLGRAHGQHSRLDGRTFRFPAHPASSLVSAKDG